MAENILQKFKNIRMVVMDVDGVLTNGQLLVTEKGEQLRSFNIKDGYAMQLAIRKNLLLAVISGSHNDGVVKRLEHLGMKEIFTNVRNKVFQLEKLVLEHNILMDDIAYIGDDMPDLLAMKLVGLPIAPADATSEIKEAAKYISPFNGGEGCVRDVLEKILKLQGGWE